MRPCVAEEAELNILYWYVNYKQPANELDLRVPLSKTERNFELP
jgi:hypothetical protein